MVAGKVRAVKIVANGAVKYGPVAIGVVKKVAKNPKVRAAVGKAAHELAANPALRKQAIAGAGKVAKGAAKGAGVAAHGAAAVAKGAGAVMAAKAAVKAGSAADKAEAAAAYAKDKGAMVGDAAKRRVAEAKEKHQEKKIEAARAEEVMSVVNAASKMTAAEFDEVYASPELAVNPLEAPGCYLVFLLNKPLKPNKNTLYYDEVYVGVSDNMAEDVRRHFAGDGNVDVYADHRHKRDLQYLAFLPGCGDKRDDLIELLGADESYNVRER